MQSQVREFHKAIGQDCELVPEFRNAELRVKLIAEESQETLDAIKAGDMVGAIDGMCDVLYVVFGTALAFGIDLEPFFDEVHRSNMQKIGGPVREDGKMLKPPGWQPPRIREMLAELKNKIQNQGI